MLQIHYKCKQLRLIEKLGEFSHIFCKNFWLSVLAENLSKIIKSIGRIIQER